MTRQLKVLIMGSIMVIGLGALLFFAQPDEHERMTGIGGEHNVLQPSQELYDFGTISMKDGLVTTKFMVKNTQPEAVRMTKLYTSCMCTKARLLINGSSEGPFGMIGHGAIPTFNQTIEPNAEAEIEVVFDPNAHGPSGVGLIQRQVVLEGPSGALAAIEIKANVTP